MTCIRTSQTATSRRCITGILLFALLLLSLRRTSGFSSFVVSRRQPWGRVVVGTRTPTVQLHRSRRSTIRRKETHLFVADKDDGLATPDDETIMTKKRFDDGPPPLPKNGALLESSRRDALLRTTAVVLAAAASSQQLLLPEAGLTTKPAWATEEVASSSRTTATAEVTDKVFVEIKGLPASSEGEQTASSSPRRIVIGLFGKDAPRSTNMLRQLVSSKGLPAPCRPKTERTLQKEQLEANKVYNACIENESDGVSLRFSTIWRIRKDERAIDVGAVTGKFVARQYPDWQEDGNNNGLKHDQVGVVSVRRGMESGFGFTIYAGNDDNNNNNSAERLDEDHIVIGRVVDGIDVVQQLINDVPVVASSSAVNYMKLTGGPKTSNAPDRSCRYGGPMYCNENKPLVKLKIENVGSL